MEWKTFQLVVVTGILPIVFQSVPRQYHLIQDVQNWTEAQTFCRLNFTDLATVENLRDMANLMTEAKNHNYSSKAWVGLYNGVNSWRCSLNGTPLGRLEMWAPGEPNNQGGHEECAKMDQKGLWYDAVCSQKNAFLCYDANNTGTNKFILISKTKRTWTESQAYCRQHHTDLACPADSIENTALEAKITSGTVWFGFFRDNWKWSDKTNVSTILWKKGKPDNAGGHDNCAFALSSGFVDHSCSERLAFFCYSYPTKRKILIRFEAQSSQDVNDPVVMAAVVEKVQEKLEEQGMAEGTSLTWRVQPNGMVFYNKEERDP